MQTVEVDTESAVVTFVAAAMREYDALERARTEGAEAVSRVIRSMPADLYQRAIDELRADPMRDAAFPKVEAMHTAQQQVRNVTVQYVDEGIRWRTHPEWIAAAGAWGTALSEVAPFCRRL